VDDLSKFEHGILRCFWVFFQNTVKLVGEGTEK